MKANQQQWRVQPYRCEPTLTSLNAGRQELRSNDAPPPGRMKYEYGMKNKNYHNSTTQNWALVMYPATSCGATQSNAASMASRKLMCRHVIDGVEGSDPKS